MTGVHIQKHNLKRSETNKSNYRDSSNPSETAQYIADMLLELRNLAKAADLKPLQGLLELGYYEAYSTAHRAPIPEGEAERLEQMGEDARKAEG